MLFFFAWANIRMTEKGGLGLRGVAFMTALAVLTVLESTLPSFCLSYKIQCQETTVTVSAVVAVSVVTATPFKLNPSFSSSWNWPRGSTGVQRYGCIPRSAANNLGEIPQKLGAPNPLFWRVFLGREHIGTRPCQSPSHFGIRLYFLRPHFPSPNENSNKSVRIVKHYGHRVKHYDFQRHSVFSTQGSCGQALRFLKC